MFMKTELRMIADRLQLGEYPELLEEIFENQRGSAAPACRNGHLLPAAGRNAVDHRAEIQNFGGRNPCGQCPPHPDIHTDTLG